MICEQYTKTAKIGYITMSAILGAIGVMLIVVPDFSTVLAARKCGGTLAAFGIFKLIGFFQRIFTVWRFNTILHSEYFF